MRVPKKGGSFRKGGIPILEETMESDVFERTITFSKMWLTSEDASITVFFGSFTAYLPAIETIFIQVYWWSFSGTLPSNHCLWLIGSSHFLKKSTFCKLIARKITNWARHWPRLSMRGGSQWKIGKIINVIILESITFSHVLIQCLHSIRKHSKLMKVTVSYYYTFSSLHRKSFTLSCFFYWFFLWQYYLIV